MFSEYIRENIKKLFQFGFFYALNLSSISSSFDLIMMSFFSYIDYVSDNISIKGQKQSWEVKREDLKLKNMENNM